MKSVLHSRSLLSSAINYLEEWPAVASLCYPGPKLWPSEVRTGSGRERVAVLPGSAVGWIEGPVATAPGSDLITANSLSGLRGDVSGIQAVLEISRVCGIVTLWRFGHADALSAVFIEGYNNAKPAEGSAKTANGSAKGADGSATAADSSAKGADGSAKGADGFAKGAVAVATSGGGPAKPRSGLRRAVAQFRQARSRLRRPRPGLRRALSGLGKPLSRSWRPLADSRCVLSRLRRPLEGLQLALSDMRMLLEESQR